MTTSDESVPTDFLASVSLAFIQNARELLREEYLPKIERCVERLTDEQVWWRPNDESNSIGNLLLHISGNASQWIVCGLGGATDDRQRQTEFDERTVIPRDQLLVRLKGTVVDVDQALERFDPVRLLDKYRIQGTEVTALTAIFHVTEHFAMHTGQIILLTKMLTKSDLVFYDFSTGKPVHTWHQAPQNRKP
ncbi:MAG TPA: DinB family protein [Pyrinomonadaceae bacterium]